MFELRDCPIHRFICVPKPSRRIEISWQTPERCGARTLSHKEANIRHKFLRPGMPMRHARIQNFVIFFLAGTCILHWWHAPSVIKISCRMPHAA